MIEKLCRLPNTSKILESKGVLMTSESKRRLQMGKAVIARLKQSMSDIKPRGGSHASKLNAYKVIKSTLASAPLTKYTGTPKECCVQGPRHGTAI